MADENPHQHAAPETPPAESGSGIPADLLEILRCPLGKERLLYQDGMLVCTRCGAKFRIEDGFPIMLIEEATLPEGVSAVRELECYSE